MKHLNKPLMFVLTFMIAQLSISIGFAQTKDTTEILTEAKTKTIVSILRGDIIKSFGLENIYDTELKKKRFMSSSEARSLKDSLKTLRSLNLSKNYEIDLTVEACEYDLKKKGFVVRIDYQYYGYSSDEANEESFQEYKLGTSTIQGIDFPSLPLKVVQGLTVQTASQLLSIKCDETTATKMENHKVNIRLIFKLNGDLKKLKKFAFLYYEDVFYPTAKNVVLVCELNNEKILEIKYK